eukprot:11907116-Alexandrium_andersonii.AAC.1
MHQARRPDATRECPRLRRYRRSPRGAHFPVPVVAVRRFSCHVSWDALLMSKAGRVRRRRRGSAADVQG